MKSVLSLALVYALVCTPLTGLQAQAQGAAPGQGSPQGQDSGVLTGRVGECTGVISGTVSSQVGRPLSEITMQLVDSAGAVLAKTVTSKNGEFTMPGIQCGTNTLECVSTDKVLGTSSVTLTGASESVKMTCTSDVVPFWLSKVGVLTALGAAAVAIGTTAIVSTGDPVSPAR